MDQEVEIISSETRKEKIKNFLINKKKNNNYCSNIFAFSIIRLLFLSRIQKREQSNFG